MPRIFEISSASFSVSLKLEEGGPKLPPVAAEINILFAPSVFNWPLMKSVAPIPVEISETTAAIPIAIPTIVRTLLSFLSLMLHSAIPKLSR